MTWEKRGNHNRPQFTSSSSIPPLTLQERKKRKTTRSWTQWQGMILCNPQRSGMWNLQPCCRITLKEINQVSIHTRTDTPLFFPSFPSKSACSLPPLTFPALVDCQLDCRTVSGLPIVRARWAAIWPVYTSQFRVCHDQWRRRCWDAASRGPGPLQGAQCPQAQEALSQDYSYCWYVQPCCLLFFCNWGK